MRAVELSVHASRFDVWSKSECKVRSQEQESVYSSFRHVERVPGLTPLRCHRCQVVRDCVVSKHR